MDYPFPVSNPFQARDVTELDFKIRPDSEIYVNLDEVRGKKHWQEILFNLNIGDDYLETPTESFRKIIFSGHRGCGKSLELLRFQGWVNHPRRYASVLIEIERETEIATFQAEDLHVLLIAKLIEKLSESGESFNSAALNSILDEWLSESEVKKELKSNYGIDLSGEVEAGANFFGFLKLKNKFKSVFSHSSQTARLIRKQIKKNPVQLIDRFNLALTDAREHLAKIGAGVDLLFILDGTEKIPYDIYKRIFIHEPHLIRALQANMIFSVPINSYFDIQNNPKAEFFHSYTLPMVPVNKKSTPLLEEIIARRIDRDRFFQGNALGFCVNHSGGCPRQLLRIVNKAIVKSAGNSISRAMAEEACRELGRAMVEQLDSDHLEILKNKAFHTADRKTLDLLFSLAVLKYNGQRQINPLIEIVGLHR